MRVLRPRSVRLAWAAGLLLALASELAVGPTAGAADRAPLTVSGTTEDDWAVYRLADGELPLPLAPGREFKGEVHLRVGDRERAVRVLVPPSATGPAPLLVALHGLYQTPRTSERDQRWGAVVRRESAVLVYGVGTSASWGAGTCCGRAAATGVDDVGYLDRVVQVADALRPVDPRRLYLTGFSNGAMMAYRHACERRTRVAAVLAVSGTVTSVCTGRSDVAVLHVHGTADHTVPLRGLAWSAPLASPLRPVSQTQRMFGPTIAAHLLDGYGHGWPTMAAGGYDTTGQGWAFLAAHPRRG